MAPSRDSDLRVIPVVDPPTLSKTTDSLGGTGLPVTRHVNTVFWLGFTLVLLRLSIPVKHNDKRNKNMHVSDVQENCAVLITCVIV